MGSEYRDIICNFNFLYTAYRLAHRGKSDCDYVIEFDMNLMQNLKELQFKLIRKAWNEIFNYYHITLFDPKKREIDAMTFEGRIVQHVLCDRILKPWLEKRLIHMNAACRKKKGSYFALDYVKQALAHELRTAPKSQIYVAKIDVHQFFPSIDHETLKSLFAKYHDCSIIELVFWIIDNAPEMLGIPLGNQMSQWSALYYLDKIDRLAKERYRIKSYVRYMDDMIIMLHDKQSLQKVLQEISYVLQHDRKMLLNPKTCIMPLSKGFTFLGWRFITTDANRIVKRVDSKKLKLKKQRIKNDCNAFINHEITYDELKSKARSYFEHLRHGNTTRLKSHLMHDMCMLIYIQETQLEKERRTLKSSKYENLQYFH